MFACPAGETEDQYLATERLVREVGFDRVNTAAYSPRPNTPAAEWDNQVSKLYTGLGQQIEYNAAPLVMLGNSAGSMSFDDATTVYAASGKHS